MPLGQGPIAPEIPLSVFRCPYAGALRPRSRRIRQVGRSAASKAPHIFRRGRSQCPHSSFSVPAAHLGYTQKQEFPDSSGSEAVRQTPWTRSRVKRSLEPRKRSSHRSSANTAAHHPEKPLRSQLRFHAAVHRRHRLLCPASSVLESPVHALIERSRSGFSFSLLKKLGPMCSAENPTRAWPVELSRQFRS